MTKPQQNQPKKYDNLCHNILFYGKCDRVGCTYAHKLPQDHPAIPSAQAILTRREREETMNSLRLQLDELRGENERLGLLNRDLRMKLDNKEVSVKEDDKGKKRARVEEEEKEEKTVVEGDESR